MNKPKIKPNAVQLDFLETQYQIEYKARSKMVDLSNTEQSPIEVTVEAELVFELMPGHGKVYRSSKKFLFSNIDDMIEKTTESWYAHNKIIETCKTMKSEILMEVFGRC